MAADKWSQVKDILDAAIRRKPEERAAFLDEACSGDGDVRAEVESLLSSFDRADGFMKSPAVEPQTVKLEIFAAGYAIGRYEIVSLIGRGGMGEVYLARDQQLRRNVAIKVLPEIVAADPERLHRFKQEAIAASALNHPNILTIHEIGESDGSHYIVSEFIEGLTLRATMASQLDLPSVVDISNQIAAALAAAHSAGIIHRDIKPDNIIIRKDGYVKVLDFGLAKLMSTFVELEDATRQPNQTGSGVIMGTVSYMSPEQARGQAVDHRTDIFSFGVVLYEMVAGTTPFAADSMPETFANLLNKEPVPLSRYVPDTPDALEVIVSRSLRKGREERYRTMDDFVDDLRELAHDRKTWKEPARTAGAKESATVVLPVTTDAALEQTAESSNSSPEKTKKRTWLAAVGVFSVLILAGAVALYQYRKVTASPLATDSTAQPTLSAQELYLQGRFYGMRENKADNDKAIPLLEDAAKLDPNNARIHATLAEVYGKRFFYFEPTDRQWEEKSSVELQKAFALVPDLAEGHEAQGFLLWMPANHFPHEQAIAAYRKAIELDPNLDEAHQQLGLIYNHIGLSDLGRAEFQKTLTINPSNTGARFRLATPLTEGGNCEEALRIIKTVPSDFNPALVGPAKTRVLICLGRLDEAAQEIESTLKTDPSDRGGQITSLKAILSGLAGNAADAEEEIQKAIEKGKGYGHFHHTAHNIADAYAVMNRPADAVRYLQMAADDGLPNYPLFEHDANLDRIRKAPEFVKFMAELKPQFEKYQREFH